VSWLPAPVPAGPDVRRRWEPGGLDGGSHFYLVVDEIVGSSVGLVLSEWPEVDERGRLRFAGPQRMLGADRAVLERFLEAQRRPSTLGRPLRIGDAFAVRVIGDALVEVRDELAAQTRLAPLLDPESWIEPPVHDVTVHAREAAKAAYYAAVTPILTPTESAELESLVGG
jgi:hypothetical protein